MPSSNRSLSIIISAYNSEKYIRQAIRSILDQTYNDFELIIADDASTDKTKYIIDSFKDPRITTSHNVENKGKIETCNRLFTIAKGKYVTIHDADDISHKHRLQKQIDFLESHQDYVMCGTSYAIFWKKDELVKEHYLESDYHKIRTGSKTQSQFHGPTVLFKKDIIDQIGGLYRYFRQGEDVDLSMRIAEKFKTTNLQEILYFYRWHQESLTKSISSFKIERLLRSRLIFFLREERDVNNGIDSLMQNNHEKIEALMKEWKSEYKDPSFIFRFGAAKTLGTRMFKNSILLAFKAFQTRPNLENLKCTLYCIRISIIKILKSFMTKKRHIEDFQ